MAFPLGQPCSLPSGLLLKCGWLWEGDIKGTGPSKHQRLCRYFLPHRTPVQHWERRGLGMRGPGWLPKRTHLPKIICHFLPSPLSSFSVILDVWPILPGSRWLRGKESASQCKTLKRWGFNPWAGKDSWRKKWQPTPLFLPREPHGQRSLVGYSPRGHKEWNTAERLSTHARTSLIKQAKDHTCRSVGLWIRPLSTQTMCLWGWGELEMRL